MTEARGIVLSKYIQQCQTIGADCLRQVLDHQAHIDLKMINLADRLASLQFSKKRIFALLAAEHSHQHLKQLQALVMTAKPQTDQEKQVLGE